MSCTRQPPLLLLALLLLQAAAICFLWLRQRASRPELGAGFETEVGAPPTGKFAASLARVLQRQRSGSCLHEFNSSLQLPLLRLQSPAESDPRNRTRDAAAWLRSSVDVVFAASVRNAMRGLPGTAEQLRGIVMSALRNIYLRFIYRQLYRPDRESLLIVVDPDLSFRPWDLDAILQGLYYFRDRPELQSLCAHTRHRGYIYDPCTLVFQPGRIFSQVVKESPVIAGLRTKQPPPGLPPVKVAGCFQAFTAYRLSHLARRRLEYGPARGETVCEHLTLSRQLTENYLDFNMRMELVSQNEGGL